MAESSSDTHSKQLAKLDIDSSQLICPKSGKRMDFVCIKKKTTLCCDRLCCSKCMLQEHSEDFQFMICLDEFFRPASEKKLSELTPKQRQEIEQFMSKKDEHTNKFTEKIDHESEKVRKYVEQLREKIDNELSKLEELINENSAQVKKEFKQDFSELKSALQPKHEDKDVKRIETYEQLKEFIEQRVKTENDLQEMKMERIFETIQDSLNCLSVMRFSEDRISDITQQFDKLISFNISVDKFSFFKKSIAVPLSNKNHNDLKCVRNIQTSHKKSIYKVVFLDEEKQFVTCSDDSSIMLWNTASGESIKTLQGHTDRIWTIIKLKDGRIASASSDQKIRIWNITKGVCERVLSGHSGYVCSLLELPHLIVVSGSQDKTAKFWDLKQTDKLLKRTLTDSKQGRIMCMTLLNNEQMAIGSEKDIQVYNIDEGKIAKTLSGHTSLLRDLLLLEDGTTLISGSDDRSIKLWNLSNYSLVRTLTGHNHSANKLHLFSTGILVSASDDYSIKFWKLETGECVKTLLGHTGWVIFCTIMNDGSLISCGADKTIKFWA